MKSPRIELILLAALLVAAAAAFWWMQSRAMKSSAPKPDVAIQDGKTIDFSTGRPIVKDNTAEKSKIDQAVKEMEDATKNVTFPPTAVTPGEKKTTEPAKK